MCFKIILERVYKGDCDGWSRCLRTDASVLDNRPHWYALQKRTRNSPGSVSPPSGSFSPHRRGGGGGGGGPDGGGGGGGKPSTDRGRQQRDGAGGRHGHGGNHQAAPRSGDGRDQQRSKGQRQRGAQTVEDSGTVADSEASLSQKSSSTCNLTSNVCSSCCQRHS